MLRWEQFFRNLQQDLKLYLFVLGVICLFRGGFIGILHEYLSDSTTGKDIIQSLYYGAKISLKSAGIITLLSFMFCSIANIMIKSPKFQSIRLGLGCIYITVLSILFQVRIPYYEQFHMTFNVFIFNTFKDDTIALFYTLIQQYNLVGRLAVALLSACLLCYFLKIILDTKTFRMPQYSQKFPRGIFRIALVVIVGLFIIFTRYGGSLTYAGGITWESAAKSKDEFLNEAILDDVQALYRAYSINERMKSGKQLHLTKEQLLEYGKYVSGYNVQSNNIEDFLKKETRGARIKKPKHIFLIIGESYAEWPLLPHYKDLNLANGMKNIIAQDNAAFVQSFLPASTSTMPAINSIITGFPEINVSPNYQAESYKAPYATSIAMQMKGLGYKTFFWYGGFGSWQRVGELTLAQGFDMFYSCSDLQNQDGNAWGSEDKYFLNAITYTFKEEQPTFHIILTTSNHPPYTVNLEKESFNKNIIYGGLPVRLKSDQEWINKLGHFWYADKVLADFVQTMYKKYPESLFVITGDHGDRVNLETNPNLFERYAVPLILYGQGVTKQMLPDKVAGSHIDIAPTLFELIAPPGFIYYSVGKSLTTGKTFASSDRLWITPDYIGKIESDTIETLSWAQPGVEPPKSELVKKEIDASNSISWWRIIRGKSID